MLPRNYTRMYIGRPAKREILMGLGSPGAVLSDFTVEPVNKKFRCCYYSA